VGSKDIQIAVIQTPKISNFTDFDALNYEPDVSVRFIGSGDVIGTPDLIILPGSKNTLADLTYLKNSGLANEIKELAEKGTPVIGICGGNQMLGTAIYDPHHMEGDIEESEGLCLVNSTTTMKDQKTTHQVTFDVENLHFLNGTFSGSELVGYEIHMGDTTPNDDTVKRCFTITKRSETPITVVDGFIDGRHQVMGTYIHGVFDNDEFRRFIINQLRLRKGLDETPVVFHYFEHKNNAYNRLADIVEEHLDMDYIMTLLKDNG
ncbi:MAG: cobyric acid synthase CobQ, partial [Veillonella sp.]|nr:cobyric acid synthase CobQ [Veillonella sp.]